MRAQLVQCRDGAIAVMILKLAQGEDFFTGRGFPVIDIAVVDIQLEQQAARLRRRFQHDRNPLPLRQPLDRITELDPAFDTFRLDKTILYQEPEVTTYCRG